MAKQLTEILEVLKPQQVRAFAHDEYPDAVMDDYNRIGVSVAEDADDSGILAQGGWTPLQYLQKPLGKPIEILTTACAIDKVTGRTTVANWETEEVIQPVVEPIGNPQLYGDDSDAPIASFNIAHELRNVKRFELALRVGKLEDARIAAMQELGYKSPLEIKRGAIATSFKKLIDKIGFRGIKDGTEKTFGLLTDPGIGSMITVSTVRTNVTKWSEKTFQEICADIRTIFTDVNVKSGTHFDGMAGDKCKLVCSPAAKNALMTENDHGKTVMQYIKDNFPGCEVVAAPLFAGAGAGGKDVVMLIADELNGSPVVAHVVPKVFQLLGVYKLGKHVTEDYTCATAGVIVLQPVGVATYQGV